MESIEQAENCNSRFQDQGRCSHTETRDEFDCLKVIIIDQKKGTDVTTRLLAQRQPEMVQRTQKKARELKGNWELCLKNNTEEWNAYVWARQVLYTQQKQKLAHIPREYFATYFEWDPIYSEKDIANAPYDKVTGADFLSFGSQKFRVVCVRKGCNWNRYHHSPRVLSIAQENLKKENFL